MKGRLLRSDTVQSVVSSPEAVIPIPKITVCIEHIAAVCSHCDPCEFRGNTAGYEDST